MFLKQEKPEMDDFEKNTNLDLKEKYWADAFARNASFISRSLIFPNKSSTRHNSRLDYDGLAGIIQQFFMLIYSLIAYRESLRSF